MVQTGTGEIDGDPMLPKDKSANAGEALHRRGTGGKDATGVRAMRQPHRDEATESGIEKGTETATGTSRCLRAGTPQHPTGATRATGAEDDLLLHARTHPAIHQRVMTGKSHPAAGMTHRQHRIPATTPTTAPCLPSHPTRGRSRKTHRRGRPGGEGPAGRAPAPRGAPTRAPGRAPNGARAGTSQRSTSTRTARRPRTSWTS